MAAGRSSGRPPRRPADRPHRGPSDAAPEVSPRDTYITVYGRMPVLEALQDPGLEVAKVLVADGAHGRSLDAITAAAVDRGVEVRRTTAQRVKLIAGNGRHDQGVAADVIAPSMRPVESWQPAADHASVLVLDQVTNPANVGMVLRAATAAGIDGVVLPRVGSPGIDPLVIKASAGVAFHAPVLRASTAAAALDVLGDLGFTVYGLTASSGTSLYAAELSSRSALVIGGETDGISDEAASRVHAWLSLPMTGGVESLNVATAAAVCAYELLRRRLEVGPASR